ncbi:MAG: AzlC family ABC transporter permease [Ilumatobacteraceae bacterium]
MRHLRHWLFGPCSFDEYRAGVRSMMPFALAISVWGLVTGVAMVNGGMTMGGAAAVTLFVFAGSAQLAVLPLLAVGTPLPIVWVTALLVNLRFVIFAAASRSYFVRLPWQQRLLAGYLNGDLGFALFSRRFADAEERGTSEQYGFFYGGATVNWVAWQMSSMLGIVLGGLAPTSWGLDLAAALALVAVLIPMANKLPAVAGLIVTAVLSVLLVGMPMRLGLLVSIVAGGAVAVAADQWRERRDRSARSLEPVAT